MGPKFIFRTQLTDIKTVDLEGVGVLRQEGALFYRWVVNGYTQTTTIPVGGVCCHQFTDGTTAEQNVYIPATATLGLMAGVAQATLQPNTGTGALCYGWIQVFGPNTQVGVTGTVAAGAQLIGVNGQTYAAGGSAMGTAPVYSRGLIMLDSVTTSTATTGQNVLVQCL